MQSNKIIVVFTEKQFHVVSRALENYEPEPYERRLFDRVWDKFCLPDSLNAAKQQDPTRL